MLLIAEADPKAFVEGLRETWESVTLVDPDSEMFNPAHRCGSDCWHSQLRNAVRDRLNVEGVMDDLTEGDIKKAAVNLGKAVGLSGLEGLVRGAARFVRRKFL